MMTHDPFQNYQTPGAYQGASPFGLPYGPFQTPFNPLAGQQFANPGIGGYGIYPQSLQGIGLQGAGIGGPQGHLQQLLALQNPLLQNPLLQNPLLQNPLLQNPLIQNSLLQQQLSQSPWQNPLLTASLQQNPLLNPAMAYHGWPQQQSQLGYPLAPQSFIGAGGGIGQIHPLAQAALRQAAGYF
jgi:hypothetical protein